MYDLDLEGAFFGADQDEDQPDISHLSTFICLRRCSFEWHQNLSRRDCSIPRIYFDVVVGFSLHMRTSPWIITLGVETQMKIQLASTSNFNQITPLDASHGVEAS